jgi:predicted transcriptional regulator
MRGVLKLRFIVDIDAEYEKKITGDCNKKRLEMITQFFNQMLENKPILIEVIKDKFLSYLQWGHNYTETFSELLPDRINEIGTSIAKRMPPEIKDFIIYILTKETTYEIEGEQIEMYRDIIFDQFIEPQVIRARFFERTDDNVGI